MHWSTLRPSLGHDGRLCSLRWPKLYKKTLTDVGADLPPETSEKRKTLRLL